RCTSEDPTGWHFQIVDSEGDVGRWTSLALDSSYHPHISYYDHGSGDLRYARLAPTGDESLTEEPTVYSLLSVSPNPFGTSTTVSYTLRRPGAFLLDAYDAWGRKVAAVAHGVAAGSAGQLVWSPVGLPPGAYVLHLSIHGAAGAAQRVIHVR
ncbi:MAG: hypothetical protein MUE60_02870, partial [Candidatus Eisenbacteria bacterium]|nr:hypothetical protein [Candidatus Eisenbacteria bacterium]